MVLRRLMRVLQDSATFKHATSIVGNPSKVVDRSIPTTKEFDHYATNCGCTDCKCIRSKPLNKKESK